MSATQENIVENAAEGQTVLFESDGSDWEKDDFTVLDEMVAGENGSLSHKTSGNFVLDLFFRINRDLAEDINFPYDYENLLRSASIVDIVNAIVLAFQTRNCRGGKGEKKLFEIMFAQIYRIFPLTSSKLMYLIPEYGCWKDLLVMKQPMRSNSMVIFAEQLKKDVATEGPISLCAKWCPRENGQFHKDDEESFRELVKFFCGSSITFDEYRRYRKAVSSLSKRLDIAEIKMCSNKYEDIDYGKIPATHLAKWMKSHLNEKENGDLRYPNNEGRMKARDNLLSRKKVKGIGVNPHDITSRIMLSSDAERQISEQQWSDIVSQFRGGIRKYIPVSDVSSSMNGIPLDVSIALGILTSEISHSSFKDRIVTFHETPSWVDLSDCADLRSKVSKVRGSEWGSSTNLVATFDLILEIIERDSILASDIPDLVIFSDMQFDEICHDDMSTHLENISRKFSVRGFERPRIVFWNLRSCQGVPAKSDHDNVILLSGYSPSLLKYLIFDESVEVTPEITFNQIINDKMYDKVREILSESNEGRLSEYSLESQTDAKMSSDI